MSYLVNKESSLPEVTRYIHRGYFQSGLNTNKKRDYPWSSYRIYLGRKAPGLVETDAVLSRFGRNIREQRRRYQEFVENRNLKGSAHANRQDLAPLLNASGITDEIPSRDLSSQNHNREAASLQVAARILREVSLSLNPSEVRDLRESRRRALARHVAMYLIRKQTSLPLRSIGALLGVKAPAVALGIGKVEQLLKREDFSNRVKSLLESTTLSSSGMGEEDASVQKELFDGNPVA